jgi:hypothetical protein
MKTAVTLLLIAIGSPGAEEGPAVFGWVNPCMEFSEEAAASEFLSELGTLGFSCCGYLWAPDWASLSEFSGWLVYNGPFNRSEDAATAACRLLWKFPDTRSVLVSHEPGVSEVNPVPEDLTDLAGLIPPTQDFMHQSPVPEEWDTRWSTEGKGEEWERPLLITSSPPGWIVEEWEDIYAGTVELRAVFSTHDPADRFEELRELLRSAAVRIDAELVEDNGEYVLLHGLPNPGDRQGDWDFWACTVDEGLEYGMRVRSFYGEPVYCWENIPASARSTPLPVTADDWLAAGNQLMERIRTDSVYDPMTLGSVSFSLSYMDGLDDDAWRDYFDLTLREVHRPGGSGDPETSPVLDRFRVYARGNEILWWHPVYGEYLPFDELMNTDFRNCSPAQ